MKIIKKLGLILLFGLMYLPSYFQIGVIVTKVKHHEPIKIIDIILEIVFVAMYLAYSEWKEKIKIRKK